MEEESQGLHDPGSGNKWSMMSKVKLALIIIFILLFGIFLGKNFTPTGIWLFGWNVEVPLILIALACFFFGLICGWVLNVIYRRRLEEE